MFRYLQKAKKQLKTAQCPHLDIEGFFLKANRDGTTTSSTANNVHGCVMLSECTCC